MTRVLRASCAHPTDHVVAGHLARKLARELGFDDRAANDVAIAVGELVSNAVRHARGGALELRELASPRPGIEIVVSDEGPGIASTELAMADGWSRGGPRAVDRPPSEGLGCGLGAVRRLMDELDIASGAGGTVVTARRYLESTRS